MCVEGCRSTFFKKSAQKHTVLPKVPKLRDVAHYRAVAGLELGRASGGQALVCKQSSTCRATGAGVCASGAVMVCMHIPAICTELPPLPQRCAAKPERLGTTSVTD